MAKDIVLCTCARHFTVKVSLFTQVYKCMLANLRLVTTLEVYCVQEMLVAHQV